MKKFFSNNWVIGIGLLILGPIVLKIIDAIAKTNILGGIWDYIKPFFTFFVKDFNISIWVFILMVELIVTDRHFYLTQQVFLMINYLKYIWKNI